MTSVLKLASSSAFLWASRSFLAPLPPRRGLVSLAGEVLVHGELVNLRWTPCKACGGHPRSDAVFGEPVEVLTGLPEVENAPTAFHRTGRVKDESIRRISVRVDRCVELVVLLGGDASQLDSDSYSHNLPSCDLAGHLTRRIHANRAERGWDGWALK